MLIRTAIDKRAFTEVPPRPRKVNRAIACPLAYNTAVDKVKAPALHKVVAGRGNKARAPLFVKRYKLAVLKIRLRPAENKVHRPAYSAIFKQVHRTAVHIQLVFGYKPAVAHHQIIGEGRHKQRILSRFQLNVLCIKAFGVNGKRHALPNSLRVGVGVFDCKLFKRNVLAGNAQRVGAEGVVLPAVGMLFARVIVVRNYCCFTPRADKGNAVRFNFRLLSVNPRGQIYCGGPVKAVQYIL